MLACLSIITTFFWSKASAQQTTLQVVTLSANPSPQEISSAKQALQNGEIVMMQGDDAAQYDGILDLSLELEPDLNIESGTAPEVLQIVAAWQASNGSLHSYECYTPAGYQDTGENAGQNCTAAFQAWVDEEELEASGVTGTPEPLAQDWTELGRPDVDYFDAKGNKLSDYVRLYRLNDNNFQYDWYLVARDPLSVPNYYKSCSGFTVTCGYTTNKRDFQTSLSAYASNPGFTLYEWAPRNEIKHDTGSVDIGLSLTFAVPHICEGKLTSLSV